MFNKKEYDKIYYQKNKLKRKKQRKEYYRNNKEKIKIYRKNYFLKNKERSYFVKNNYRKFRDFGLYHVYSNIIARCNYNSCPDFKYYGKRGIKFLWKNYNSFKKDMYSSYLEHLKKYGKIQTTIERINNDGNYEFKNCRWATRYEQTHNRRKKLSTPI